MKIHFSPQRNEQRLTVSKAGDVLTINDVEYDFTPLGEGEQLPAGSIDCAWINGDVIRKDGVIELCLLLPHGTDAPQETLFPETIIAEDGVVTLPPYGDNR